MSSVLTMPRSVEETNRCQYWILPDHTKRKSANVISMEPDWVTIRIFFLGTLSMMTPANSEKSKTGRNWRALTRLNKNADLVSM